MKGIERIRMAGSAAVLLVVLGWVSAQGPATTIRVEVKDGPNAGIHEVESADVTCSYGLAGEGLWGNQFSVGEAAPSELSSLQLIVDAAAAGDEEGTDEFLTTISFGPLFTPEASSYTIRSGGNDPRGSGTVRLDDRGTSGTVHISAISETGVAVDATIECHRMLRFDSPADSEPDPETGGPVSLTAGDEVIELLASSEEAFCEEALAEDNDFQYTYSPVEFEGALLIGLEVYLPDRNSPDEVYVSVTLPDSVHWIDTLQGGTEGSGRVTVSASGDRRLVEVEAVTGDDVPVQLRAECTVPGE